MKKRIISLFMAILLVLTQFTVFASASLDAVFADTLQYIYDSTPNPTVSAIGGEWAMIGLARSGGDVDSDIYDAYSKNIEAILRKNDGVLHEKKYTEYSRAIIALTATGKNPQDIAGTNLLEKLADYEKTVWQGTNGPVWALVALDCGKYEIPQIDGLEIQATRQLYVDKIVTSQLTNGGWSLTEDGEADVDITAMALVALSKYREQKSVGNSIDKALTYLSEEQNENGGFSNYGSANCESDAQVIVALCELGISPDDERFVKNGRTVTDSLLSYYNNNGSFSHINNGESNQMATEQALIAMSALKRNGNTLYDMTDVEKRSDEADNNTNGIAVSQPVIYPGRSFDDISNSSARAKIEALASRGIINGRSEALFAPDETMTRAEFATIVVKALGLEIESEKIFDDVLRDAWYFDFIATAYQNGIVNGVSETEFNPNGTITKEQATVMVANAAKLCGLGTEYNDTAVRNILAGFTDYMQSSEWARASLALCYDSGILDSADIEILPKKYVTRAEIADMLFNLLDVAGLIQEEL